MGKVSELPKTSQLQVARERDGLTLTGKLGERNMRVRLRRVDPGKINLTSMGFRWINEYPDNR